MVSSFMPDVQVEIAFNAGYTTPAASRTWTDVSAYVELHEGMSITFGRQDERATADANQLTLTLDNTDGRFTATRAASPYYPNVKLGRPIRVRVTPPGGSTVTRFVGFIDEWPIEWDGTDAYAVTKVRASSRLSRLGLNASLRSVIEQEILADSPSAYWTLGDPSGSTSASDSSGSGQRPLSVAGSGAPVTFGNATGPAVDGLTATTFANGQFLSSAFDGPVLMARASVLLTTPPAGGLAYVFAGVGFTLAVNLAGNIGCFNTATGTFVITGPSINDGATHDVALVLNAGVSVQLYVDGVSVGTSATTATTLMSTGWGLGLIFEGTISHAAAFSTAPSAARIAEHATAVLTGYAGDRTDERVVRLLGWAGVASTEIAAETGAETMTYQLTSGQSVVDALRECESTEGGVLYDRPDGNVGFHNRSRRYLSAPVATLNMASQHVESDYAPKLDRSTLLNDATVSNPTTGETARALDAASSVEYGVATGSATSVADSYDPVQQKASWLVASYAEPRSRVPSLTVDVLAHQGLTPSAQTLLGITVGDMITVEDQPIQAPFPGGDWLLGGGELGEVILGDAPSGHLFVEGYTETIGAESYSLTFNLSPTHPTLNTFVLDDAIRGLLDADNLLAL